jgi:hypothetical protein
MRTEYVHQKLGEDVHALAGYYTPLKEVRLKHDGREVLYIVGSGTVESSCCGGTGCLAYAIVPGYLVAWKNKRNKESLPVSEVTPIADEETRRQIARIIQETEGVCNIEFW